MAEQAGAPAERSPAALPAPPPTRIVVALGITVLVAISALYVLLPAVAGLEDTWNRLARGDPWWLTAALGLELLSFASYVVLFRFVFAEDGFPVGWSDSYRITMAGVAATRLLAMAGAGGIALTAWALSFRGMPGREVAARISAFLVLLYAVFMVTLVLVGTGLRTGLLEGAAPFGLTVVPALFGASVIAGALLIRLLSVDLEQALSRFAGSQGRFARWWRALAVAPATIATGISGARELLRTRRPQLLGAIGWWAFDVAVLWACLRAFGGETDPAVVVMAYFVGLIANLLPLPTGIGTVDAGMIGALVGFGVAPGLAIVGVLSYRAFAFWLPTVPGLVAYLQLLRESREARAPASPEPGPAGPP